MNILIHVVKYKIFVVHTCMTQVTQLDMDQLMLLSMLRRNMLKNPNQTKMTSRRLMKGMQEEEEEEDEAEYISPVFILSKTIQTGQAPKSRQNEGIKLTKKVGERLFSCFYFVWLNRQVYEPQPPTGTSNSTPLQSPPILVLTTKQTVGSLEII